jgi:hypothetical protein
MTCMFGFWDQKEFTSLLSYGMEVAELATYSRMNDRLMIIEVGNATHFW